MTKSERKRRDIVIERYKSVFEQLADSKRKEISDEIVSGKFYSLKELEKEVAAIPSEKKKSLIKMLREATGFA